MGPSELANIRQLGLKLQDILEWFHLFSMLLQSYTLHETGIYAYIDPLNHPNVGGIYGSPMERLGKSCRLLINTVHPT